MKQTKNYALKELPIVKNGEVLEGYIFSRMIPHTKVFEGIEGLTFLNCNIRNCDLPKDAVIKDCSGVNLHVSRCSHVHPDWVADGLSECMEVCDHIVDTDEIRIDGTLIETIYHYEDKQV